MQKLLYYAQAWYLVNFNKRLFSDPIKAMEMGPIIVSVYNKYKKFYAGPIICTINKHNLQTHQKKFLKDFFGIYACLSATALISMIHSEKPWQNAYNKNLDIDVKEMKEFYTKQYEDSERVRKDTQSLKDRQSG